MNHLVDGWLSPPPWLLGAWSLRWALMIALAMAWLAIRPPRTAAVRMLALRLLLVTGMSLPFVPSIWGPALPEQDAAPSAQATLPVRWPPRGQHVGVEIKPESAPFPVVPWASSRDGQAAAAQAATDNLPGQAAVQPLSVSQSLGWVRWTKLVLATLWLFGVMVAAVRLGVGWCCLRRLRRTAEVVGHPECQADFDYCRQRLRVTRVVQLGMHEAVGAPILLGGWRPWILVPPGWRELASAARRAILLHELAHVQRRDDTTKFCEELVRVFFFFHPFVHWLLSRIDADREELCDATVVNEGVTPRELAAVLVECCRRCGPGRPALVLPAVALLFFRRRTVMERIQSLMEEKTMARWKTKPPRRCAIALLVLTVGAAATVGGFGARPAGAEPPAEAALTKGTKAELPTVKEIQARYRENFTRLMPFAVSYRVREVETMARIERQRRELGPETLLELLNTSPKSFTANGKPLDEKQIEEIKHQLELTLFKHEDPDRRKRLFDPKYINLCLAERTSLRCWFCTDGKSFHARWPGEVDKDKDFSLSPGPVSPPENLKKLYGKITLMSWSSANNPPLRCWWAGGGGRVARRLSDCTSSSMLPPLGFVRLDWTTEHYWHDFDRFMSEESGTYQVIGPTDLNGKKVIVIDGIFPPCPIHSGPRHVRVSIDPSQGYLPLRMEWRCADAAGKPTTLLERVIDVPEVHEAGGAYYPKRILCQDYLGNDVAFEKQRKEKAAGRIPADAPPPPTIPSTRTIWEVTEVIPHRAIAPAELRLEFPGGARYSNAVDNRMYRAGNSTPLPQPPEPPRPGAVPPALQIARWSDGKARKLSDYLGKVVVLDFSGIPGPGGELTDSFQKGLHEKYPGGGVVFLGIHRPRTDLNTVLKYQEERGWKTPAGIDDQYGTGEGVTERLYASAVGLVVIGRDGKVAFNTGAVDEETGLIRFRRAAQKLSIPWPLKEDGPKDVVDRQSMQLFDFMIKEQIDEALGKP